MIDHQRLDDLQQLSDSQLSALGTTYAAFVVEWSESSTAVLARLKQMASKHRPPIFALCGVECIDHIAAMVVGADYILQKPLNALIMQAALRASRRRYPSDVGTKPERNSAYRLLPTDGWPEDSTPSVRIDERRRQFFAGCTPVDLTQREFDLMALFMDRPDECLSRDSLLESLWGFEYDGSTNVVDVMICNIRKKLALHRLDSSLQTVRGVGYRFVLAKPSASSGFEATS